MPATLYPQTKEGAVPLLESSAGKDSPGPFHRPEFEMSPAFRRELLDLTAWEEGLYKYALAMHLAVALADANGSMLGACLNPQRLWGLFRAQKPAGSTECAFALAPPQPCTCVADALSKGRTVWAEDRAGLVHFAVPLVLGGEQLGALIAGQVFDHYPEQLPLERAAKQFGLSPTEVWQTARLEHPVSPATLQVYADLLTTLGQALLQSRYHALLEAARLIELRRADEALRKANDELERRVAERTAALEEAQKKALQAERLAAIGQLVTGLAHESRNALQRSQACLTMLELRMQDRPDALDLLGRLQNAHDDLHRLYEDVREYAAPIQLHPRVCDLAQVWREAWADLAPLAELREETGGLDLRCLADPFQLKQLFRNLLDNALHAADDPVRVTVYCRAAQIEGMPALQVAVRDNGPGIAEELQQKVFEPFFTTKAHGTGLGLAICKRIVEAHGGLIAVGDGTSAGAEILVTLPRRRV
jgi:signal transduction histidine kinase